MQAQKPTMVHDACYKKVMSTYGKWSARAAQAVAKCRKSHGNVRKSAAGASLKRWAKEKWVNTKTGRPCGNETDRTEYCRPTKKVSAATPSKGSAAARAQNYRRKAAGKRAKRVGKR